MSTIRDETKHMTYPPDSDPPSSLYTGANGEPPSSIVGIFRSSSYRECTLHRDAILASTEKVIQELAVKAGLPADIPIRLVGEVAKSNYMPQVLGKDKEQELRRIDRAMSGSSENLLRVHRRCRRFTKGIRRALRRQEGMRFAINFGLDGIATSWDRLVEFCDEEKEFYLLFGEPTATGDEMSILDAVPYGPLGNCYFGRYNSKDFLLDPLLPHIQA
ncbi:hypothetical protein MBLNU457_3270t1 [Dothideomycetes sp. NU457]